MKYIFALAVFISAFAPTNGFASLQCTDIFTIKEQPIVVLDSELVEILKYNEDVVQAFATGDALLVSAKTYEEISYAVKNKLSLSNELIDTVVQNILFLNSNSVPEIFARELSKMSEDAMSLIEATWNLSNEQLHFMLELRIQRAISEMNEAQDRAQERQPFIGFRENKSTSDETAPTAPGPIGFRTTNSKPQNEVPILETTKTAEETTITEQRPIGFIHFPERPPDTKPIEPGEIGFIPRKEPVDNFPSFELLINPKTGELDAVNPDAKIGFRF